MASPLQTLRVTMLLVSLFLGCAEKASGIRFIPNYFNTVETKRSDSEFLVNNAPQPSSLAPGLGRFLLPPQPETPFYESPLATAPVPSDETPSQSAPSPGYESCSPSYGEDQVPPVPQPKHFF